MFRNFSKKEGQSSISHSSEQKLSSLGQLESLGLLAGKVAHDLNNILTSVLGHVSFLRLTLPEGGPHTSSVLAIEEGARRGASMTQEILDFVRCQPTEYHVVDLKKIVEAAVNLIQPGLAPSITLTFTSEALVSVYGNESQLSQVIMNLTLNARDALSDLEGESARSPRIDIVLENIPVNKQLEKRKSLDLTTVPYVKLIVRDNGIGIPADVQERIFEPFFTTKKQGGTGLGLATVSSIVRLQSGVLEVESKEGFGTQFSIYLPALSPFKGQNEQTPEQRESQHKRKNIPMGNEAILVVDDEETVRTVIQRCLEHLGYEVEVAVSGEEAIQLYRKNARKYRLVILDMLMPQMPGDEVFFRLQEIDPSIPVLIASGYASDDRSSRVLRAGAVGFLQKPFAVEELAGEVRRCLDEVGQ